MYSNKLYSHVIIMLLIISIMALVMAISTYINNNYNISGIIVIYFALQQYWLVNYILT
jgi:uncharacterized membrane-anchored protein